MLRSIGEIVAAVQFVAVAELPAPNSARRYRSITTLSAGKRDRIQELPTSTLNLLG